MQDFLTQLLSIGSSALLAINGLGFAAVMVLFQSRLSFTLTPPRPRHPHPRQPDPMIELLQSMVSFCDRSVLPGLLFLLSTILEASSTIPIFPDTVSVVLKCSSRLSTYVTLVFFAYYYYRFLNRQKDLVQVPISQQVAAYFQ